MRAFPVVAVLALASVGCTATRIAEDGTVERLHGVDAVWHNTKEVLGLVVDIAPSFPEPWGSIAAIGLAVGGAVASRFGYHSIKNSPEGRVFGSPRKRKPSPVSA